MNETFTVTEDYYEDLTDGGRKLIFKAGTKIGMETAKALGLNKVKPKAEETKPPKEEK